MPISVKHAFVSSKPNGQDATKVRSSNWNEEHILTVDSQKLVGRASPGNGPAEEIGIGSGVSIQSGNLTVTKGQIGLGNVDNTSDANKPISTATQTALDAKSDKATTYTKTETDSRIQTVSIANSAAAWVFGTLAQLNANLTPAADSQAWVVLDGANNGIYRKSGGTGTGSWARISPLPVTSLKADLTSAPNAAQFSNMIMVFVDANDLVIAGFDSSGALVTPSLKATNIELTGSLTQNGGNLLPSIGEVYDNGDLWVLIDSLNRTILRADKNGRFVAPAIRTPSLNVDTIDFTQDIRKNGASVVPLNEPTVENDLYAIVDQNGSALLRIDRSGRLISDLSIYGVGDLPAARGSRSSLSDRLGEHLSPHGSPRRRFGFERLRETRQRLMCRKLGESRQLTIATIGDSFTHNPSRWTGPAASYLMNLYGDAGGGWLGFGLFSGTNDGGTGLRNGNVRSSSYVYTSSGLWDYSAYYTSNSPDIAQITSTNAGDSVTVTGPSSPNLSVANLFWIGTSDGVVRYRWNGGSWTTLSVQGGVGTLGTAALSVNMPTSGTWSLNIEVVSGTVTLCGVDFQSVASGERWHKLGSTGSRASQWAATSSSTVWRAGLAALAPDLVVIMHGTNDQGVSRTTAQFAADMGTLIDSIRAARPTADVLVMMPPENQRLTNAVPMSDYALAAIPAVASRDAAWIDTQLMFGVAPADYASGSSRPWFHSDGIHPDPATGGRVLVRAFIEAIEG